MEQYNYLIGYAAFIFMGLSLGMVGSGGSILTVPILVYLFTVNPILATSYSLFIVGFTALIGGFFYLKRGAVDLKTGFIFAVPSFIGVYLTRMYVVPNLPDPVFVVAGKILSKPMLIMLVFAILMLLASLSMIRASKENLNSKEIKITPRNKKLLISLEGLIVGGITGLVGAGGGFLIIPVLVILVGMPMQIAIGTSLFIIAAKSLLGFTGDLQQPLAIEWKLLFTITGIAIVGLLLGVEISKKLSAKILKKGFGYFVLVMGVFILLDQLKKL